jgi:hypothetical protein
MKAAAMGLMSALALAGCATSKPEPIASDRPTQRVTCVPGRVDLCYVRAQQVCPDGYDEIRPENSAATARSPASGPTAAAAAPDATPTSLLIACK